MNSGEDQKWPFRKFPIGLDFPREIEKLEMNGGSDPDTAISSSVAPSSSRKFYYKSSRN